MDTDIYTDANKQFFDHIATEYDVRPGALEAANRIADAFLQAYNFDEEKTTVLDFACGTGKHSAVTNQPT